MEAFHEAIKNRDWDGLATLMTEDIVFRSPVVYAPYHGRGTVISLLTHVAEIFDDFHYVRKMENEETNDLALVFRARVGTREIEGCDFLHLNEEGLIDELFVMIRPLSGAHAVRDAMGARLETAEGKQATVSR